VSKTVTIRLEPLGVSFSLPAGTPLQDVLFAHGVEFPCGGKGKCKGCRVRLLQGSLPITPEQERMLSAEELRAGWRLSCQCAPDDDVTLEMAQWEAAILSDETAITIEPREGLGIAIDLGTTTLVAQLIDLRTGNVLSVRTALNAQARYGADIMSRITYAVAEGGAPRLTELIRKQIASMIVTLLDAAGKTAAHLVDVAVVGNTVMHHLFCGIDVTALSHFPFESPTLGAQNMTASVLAWPYGTLPVRFLPCIGGFVGSDVLAGVVATNLHRSTEKTALIDLGTNGEIVVGSQECLLCASTAAGPAFEGARIYMGMRAATGAISEVYIKEGKLASHVLGNVTPRGICGSGLVDAVAAMLELGLVKPGGRFADGGSSLTLLPPVKISQTDIRELQLAKGAIAAGIRLLLGELGTGLDGVRQVHLAGAFGNYVNTASAGRIGLLPFPPERIVPSGNTALRGAKIALFTGEESWRELASRIRHVSLHENPDFQNTYVEQMTFPSPDQRTV
jgi:uncharacterized 2Fe-2S/4Fe-4S cluster protein (DUF4445 family)